MARTRRIAKRSLLGLLALALGVTGCSAAYNAVTSPATHPARELAPSGRFVEAAGVLTHYERFGKTGSPIVLVGGFLEPSDVWDGVARLLARTDPVHKVTIIPRGRALGVTMQLPAEDRYSMDAEMILQNIAVLFGGRIAEEIFMKQMTTGASNDFERATEMARNMVMRWGMSESLGPMVYGENEGEVFLGRSITTHKNVSESTLQKVDAEIRRIVDQQYALARKLIEANREKVEVMAKALLEWETIDAEQINDIMEGRPPRPPKPAAPPAQHPPRDSTPTPTPTATPAQET